jgi:hypothetical protein
LLIAIAYNEGGGKLLQEKYIRTLGS